MTAVVLAALSALPPTLVAWGALRQGRSNGRKADLAASNAGKAAIKAEVAATHASSTALKVDEVRAATQEISTQSDKIAAQTNGHLTKLTNEVNQLMARNEGLEKTVTTLVNILTATRVLEASAERKESITVPAVRTEDLNQALQTIQEIREKDATGETTDENH
jgi:hypothetical protein